MESINPDELVTVAQAAALRGITRQGIHHLITEGKLKTVEIAGKRFLNRSEVLQFRPDKGGRPAKNIPPTE